MHYEHITTSKSKMYLAWINVKSRCRSTSYKSKYITHPDSWETFQGFVSEMGEGYSEGLYLLRKDIDAPFSAKNCFWGTRQEMKRNSRAIGALCTKGVYRCVDFNGGWVYRAYWNDLITGKRKHKGFSESKHGANALALAIEYRRKAQAVSN